MTKITLLDWEGKRYNVEIPDDIDVIRGEILSGDMVMREPMLFDTGMQSRKISYYDGYFEVFRKDFDKLEGMRNSYDVFKIMWNN